MLKLKKLWSLQLTNGSLVLHRRYNSLSPCSFPKRVNKRHLRAQPTQTPVLPRTTYYSPRSQNCRLPPPSKRQVRKSKQKVLKAGFRWQCLSPSGQLLGTPGRPTTARRTPHKQSFGPGPTSSRSSRSSRSPRPWRGCGEGGEARGSGKKKPPRSK